MKNSLLFAYGTLSDPEYLQKRIQAAFEFPGGD